jgi:N-6 DNA Methylase
LNDCDAIRRESARAMKADQIKANGIHYTPPDLAKFLAEVLAERLVAGRDAMEILDPACGDGALLFAFSQCVPPSLRKRVSLFGYEMDEDALRQGAKLLANAGVADVVLEHRDFLAMEGVDVSSLLKKGTGSELTGPESRENSCCEVPVPLFQQAVRRLRKDRLGGGRQKPHRTRDEPQDVNEVAAASSHPRASRSDSRAG